MLLHGGAGSTLWGFQDAIEFSHRPTIAVDMEECRERPCLSLAGPVANIISWSPKATDHCGGIRAETLSDLGLQVLLRVDTRLKLPCWHIRGMGPPFEGRKLLRLHPLCPRWGVECPMPTSIHHQTGSLLARSKGTLVFSPYFLFVVVSCFC